MRETVQSEHFKHSYKTTLKNTSLYVVSTGFQRCAPEYAWGPGSRSHYLIHLVSSGRGTLAVDGKIYQIAAGEMFLAYPDKIVQYRADPEEPWEYIWVGFAGLDARFLLELAGFRPDKPFLGSRGGASAERLLNIYKSRGSMPCQAIRMTGLLYEFFAHMAENSQLPPREKEDPSLAIANQVLDFIAGHYHQPLTVEEIASQVNVSRTGLYRCLKKHFALSPMQLVMRQRLERAAFLLRNTDEAISSVARKAGFDDPLYFSRVFRAAKGCPPGRYRTGQL